MPPASITTSASSTFDGAAPTEAMRSPSMTIASPWTNGACQSPDTI
jgi:hypothetical protein